jgi:hypothetical protein
MANGVGRCRKMMTTISDDTGVSSADSLSLEPLSQVGKSARFMQFLVVQALEPSRCPESYIPRLC